MSSDVTPKQASLFRNIISWIGLLLAAVAVLNIIFFLVLEIRGHFSHPYVGILIWMVFPAVLILGLALTFGGALWERRRRYKTAPGALARMPIFDLNNPRHQKGLSAFVIGGAVFVFISTVGAYQAYEYTETTEFCGLVCHEVMHPEYIAYTNSPHARVGCVACHVGPGATWYVRSKLSGAYQVYAALVENYPRPIPTPVENLRPARETCEQCHWPEKFWGAQLKTFHHFMYDEENTPRETQMLIKTGGGSPEAGLMAGIHWHMNIANEISYVANDPQLQDIPWVRMRNRNTGETVEFLARGAEVTAEQIAEAEKHVMDCVDCHNRPTHIYTPPDQSVDTALLARTIDSSIPWIKQQAVAALSADYPSTDAAMSGIATSLQEYYATNHPDFVSSRRATLDSAIQTTQKIYRSTIFPEMKVDWRTHPNNIGHFYFPGCFRCHDDNHVSADGRVITKECDICHEVVEQRIAGDPMTTMGASPFVHPVELGDLREFACTDCHTGGGM